MRVMLTGASGFIGAYVLQALQEIECELLAVSSQDNSQKSDTKVTWVKANLLDQKDVNEIVTKYQPEVLIHLAWYAEHGKFWSSSKNFDWSIASIQLLDTFRRNGGKRAVIAGTCAEYDWSYGYCKEGITPVEPATVYGKCKDGTRRILAAMLEESGVEWIWGRIFFPFGMGEPQERLIPSVINSLIHKSPIRCSHGRQFRDFMPVEDVASAFVHLALSSNITGELNISTGIPTRISDVVERCIQHFEGNVTPEFGAIKVSDNDPNLLVGDNEKLIKSGWKPSISWQEALGKLINKYKITER